MKRSKIFKYVMVGAGSALVIGLLYWLSSVGRVVGGISQVMDTPTKIVRLQIVDGSGVDGFARRVAKNLSSYADPDLKIKIVEVVDFDRRKLSKSFVISRERNKIAARMLAQKISLDPSEVAFKPLEHNVRQVSATLVLGEDYQIVKSLRSIVKEI